MRCLLIVTGMLCLAQTLVAQVPTIYTIKADSVKFTNCDSSEFILENHTQGVNGFLYNTGNGRTQFKKGAIKINDSCYLVGADTIKVPVANYWNLNGNSGIDTSTQYLGSKDGTPVIFRVGSAEIMRLSPFGIGGSITMGTKTADAFDKLHVEGNFMSTGTVNSIGNFVITSGTDA